MRLAIIGASKGQLPICQKAKDLGIEMFCFAWDQGGICKDVGDHFYTISILEKDKIVELCKNLNIDGVVSNASELTAEVSSYVSEKLGLNGTPYRILEKLHDKFLIRQLSECVECLSKPQFYKYEGIDLNIYPCVVKPCEGSAKAGVSFVNNPKDFTTAIKYAQDSSDGDILVE